MTYTKPCIEESTKALVTIQQTAKGSQVFGDSIEPLNPNHYLTAMAYEADE